MTDLDVNDYFDLTVDEALDRLKQFNDLTVDQGVLDCVDEGLIDQMHGPDLRAAIIRAGYKA